MNEATRSRTVIRGSAWAGMGYGVQGVSQVALLAVLGRLLDPADFGIVTAALVLVNLGRLFTSQLVGDALIQRPRLTDSHVRAGFWLALSAGLVAAGLLVILAPLTASLFKMPKLDSVVRGLSVVFLIQAFSSVPRGLLLRDLDFRAVARSDAVGYAVGYAGTGIVAGVLGAGVWALVLAELGLATVQAAMLLLARGHPTTPRFSLSHAGELLYFGGGLLGGRFFNYLALQGDNLVIARTLGADALGAYGRAYQIVVMPAMLVGELSSRVLFPVFSRMQEDRAQLADDYKRGISLALAITAPISVVTFVTAGEIVAVLLGSGWEDVVLPLRILSVVTFARTAYKVSDTLSKAIGLVYSRAGRQLAYALLVIIGASVGQVWGINGVAVGVAIAIVGNHLLMAQLCLKAVPLGWAGFAAAHTRLAGATMLLALVVAAARAALAPVTPAFVTAAGAAAVGGLVYLAMAWFTPRLTGTDELRWLGRQTRKLIRARP